VRRRRDIRPFDAGGRRTVIAILATFALSSAVGVTLSISSTARSQHRATVIEVAARQRTLSERYVKEVLLARAGERADPAATAALLRGSAGVLLHGGTAPAVDGDDDESALPAPTGATTRRQLAQAGRLAADLTATGAAVVAGRPVEGLPLTAHEHASRTDPIARLRVLQTLTSNVSLNAARTIAATTDRDIGDLITLQAVLGAAGLLVTLLLAFALIAATRRRTAHFRSLVTASTDLVLAFGAGGCRYVSRSVVEMLGRAETDVLADGFAASVHPDDRPALYSAAGHGEPRELVLRVRNRLGEWRRLEAHVTDLRDDRHVRGVVLNARDATERLRLEEELTRQAFHDALTGLPNRALFRDRLDQALARSARSRDRLAVLLFDLDGFKQVNDTLGHDAGDQLLESVAAHFADVTRPSDTVARLGGDEFAVLVEGADEPLARGVADRVLECLAEPVALGGRELSVGASVGIVLHPGGEAEGEDLLRHADIAMYAAKEAGRGRSEVFRVDMAREAGELLGLEHELRLGLQRGELSLHYQPEIALDTNRLVGVEALLRWTSPTRGAVPPMRFIPIAEATGLILPLGEFVLRTACAQAARWHAGSGSSFVTWINVSGRQLTAGLEELVCSVLAETGLPASLLGLEVTETALVEDGPAGDRARRELQALRTRGVRIAIDDFGTGFSSLGQLRQFPVDMIKVDRSFVEGAERSARDAAITANLVSLAHALGLVAIAEGIESGAQLDSMRRLGCDHAQGYLFARPMPAEELDGLLGDDAWPEAA
jgi:diguanylate cyclase (GGDEF)-like protein/PAS domain S-box-containing protein